MVSEIWQTVKNHQEYEVSNAGHIRSLKTSKKRIVKSSSGRGWFGKRYMFARMDGKSELVHVLVANAFVDNTHDLEFVIHRNRIWTDNRAENLEFCTKELFWREFKKATKKY